MKKNTTQILKTLALALILAGGVQIAAADWVSAPANPPANNVDAPINAGKSSPDGYQAKLGALWVNTDTTNFNSTGFIVANGSSWFNGNVGVKVQNPTQALEVDGNVKTKGIFITNTGTMPSGSVLALTDPATGGTAWVAAPTYEGSTTTPPGTANFGGMFAKNRDGVEYKNPVTATMGCPTGYVKSYVLGGGQFDPDGDLFVCAGDPKTTTPIATFGGLYVNNRIFNPVTGTYGCPANFDNFQVFGGSKDDPINLCWIRTPNKPGGIAFGGMYGYGTNQFSQQMVGFLNPVTGNMGCPAWDFRSKVAYGASGQDYSFYLCLPNYVNDDVYTDLGRYKYGPDDDMRFGIHPDPADTCDNDTNAKYWCPNGVVRSCHDIVYSDQASNDYYVRAYDVTCSATPLN